MNIENSEMVAISAHYPSTQLAKSIKAQLKSISDQELAKENN
jgi:hypothetical protein